MPESLGHPAAMARLSFRIVFETSDAALGPGMIQLLERVAQYGSIRKAAASMQMSYRKAWLLVQKMQDTFGGPVLDTAIGGTDGGGARLTPLGTKLLDLYRRIDSETMHAAETELRALSTMAAAGGNRVPPRKKRRAASA